MEEGEGEDGRLLVKSGHPRSEKWPPVGQKWPPVGKKWPLMGQKWPPVGPPGQSGIEPAALPDAPSKFALAAR
jgi:hypothetical protein